MNMRNLSSAGASWKAMNTIRPVRYPDRTSRRLPGRTDPLEGAGPWIAFAIGLLLMLAAAIVRGDDTATVHKSERFNATLGPRSTVRVSNISGDVVASPGREFSAVCNTTVTAGSKSRAEEILGQTRTVQARDGDEVSLEARWPDIDRDGRARGNSSSRRGSWHSGSNRCPDCKITMRYEVVVPPGVTAVLRTVNGDVSVQDLDGELDVQSVNGNVVVRGSRRGVTARTVNGRVDVAASAAAAGTSLELKTVSGSVQLTLPKEAKFDLAATTMTGSIESSFPLVVRDSREESSAWDESRGTLPPSPPRAERPETPSSPRTPRPPRRVVIERDGDETLVDVAELERELAESMREVEAEMRQTTRELERQSRRMKFVIPGGEYRGSIGQGGAKVRLSTLNGKILLLAAGTKESDAKALVSRRSMVVSVPQPVIPRIAPRVVRVQPRIVVAPPRPNAEPHPHAEMLEEDTVVRGDVAGDFLASAGTGGYRIGRVTGKVHILTHSGEIHVASAGSGAELKTYGGDIQVGPVTGDLKAQTLAGDIHAGTVSGIAIAETSGGDIRVERIGSSAEARTGGGDILLLSVGGAVVAETGGGEIRIVVLARDPKGGVKVRNSGGDVTLTLPSNFRGEFDLTASDVDSDDTAIRSEFPEISVTRRSGSQQASGTVNGGGGTRVVIRTSSGSIRIRKGPAV